MREIFNSLVVEADLVKGDAAVVQRVCVVLVQLQHLQNVFSYKNVYRMCIPCKHTIAHNHTLEIEHIFNRQHPSIRRERERER